MDNKGFTLIELLSSIVILAIILALAIPSISSVSSAIKESQRENLIKKIEIAASKYAFDTNETIVFVQTLVENGYLASNNDDDDGVIDPVTNKNINCYIIKMEKKSDYYTAKFDDEKNYNENGICDIEKATDENSSLMLLYKGKDYWIRLNNLSTNWFNVESQTELKVYICKNANCTNTLSPNCTNSECIWTSNKGLYQDGQSNIVISIPESSVQKTMYTFIYRSFDSENNKIIEKTKSIELKFDNEPPIIYEDKIEVTNKNIMSVSKKITINASDGYGSGELKYHIGKITSEDPVEYCKSVESYTSINNNSATENGKYAICVKDKVGNISSTSIEITNIS